MHATLRFHSRHWWRGVLSVIGCLAIALAILKDDWINCVRLLDWRAPTEHRRERVDAASSGTGVRWNDVLAGGVVESQYSYLNSNEAEVSIERVGASCGCTHLSMFRLAAGMEPTPYQIGDAVAHNESVQITVKTQLPSEEAYFTTVVRVLGKESREMARFQSYYRTRRCVSVMPADVDFVLNGGDRGNVRRLCVIKYNSTSTINVWIARETLPSWLDASLNARCTSNAECIATLELSCRETAPVGGTDVTFALHYCTEGKHDLMRNHEGCAACCGTIPINVHAQVEPLVVAIPPHVKLASASKFQYRGECILSQPSGSDSILGDLAVVGTTVSCPDLECTASIETREDWQHRARTVVIVLDCSCQPKSSSLVWGQVRISTGIGRQPDLTVRYSATLEAAVCGKN